MCTSQHSDTLQKLGCDFEHFVQEKGWTPLPGVELDSSPCSHPRHSQTLGNCERSGYHQVMISPHVEGCYIHMFVNGRRVLPWIASQ